MTDKPFAACRVIYKYTDNKTATLILTSFFSFGNTFRIFVFTGEAFELSFQSAAMSSKICESIERQLKNFTVLQETVHTYTKHAVS